MGDAIKRWRDQLANWAIPEHILAAVEDSPWTIPTDVFARRADDSVAQPSGASYERAREAVGDDGTVLDVGSGAGAASLPLRRPIVAVDVSQSMLDALTKRATALGLPVQTIVGRWPDVADSTPVADVVVCHHVVYNAPDLDRFAEALTTHARRRVVIEMTMGHPLQPLNPLWRVMHDLERPLGPGVIEAIAVLREIGITPRVEFSPRPPREPYKSFADLVTVTRRRLCLPPERDEELAQLLLTMGVDPDDPRDLAPTPDDLVTLWWS